VITRRPRHVIPIGESMIRSSNAVIRTFLGAVLVGAFVAGCGNAAATASPVFGRTSAPPASPSAGASAGSSAGTSAGLSASPHDSASDAAPTEEPTLDISAGLAHYDAKFEDLLPGAIGGIPLSKLSMPLSTYIASLKCDSSKPCGDKGLYAPWLVGFGKTPDDATLAAATDLTQTETITIEGFKVPGIDGAKLSAAFGAEARKAGWPVNQISVAGKSVLEIIDPARKALSLLSIGYVYAKGDVMYVVLTDSPDLLVESLIKLS
jgi:hypothetical protein